MPLIRSRPGLIPISQLFLSHSLPLSVVPAFTHGNLDINDLVDKGAEGVVEAERVRSGHLSCEDKVTLSLLLSSHDDLVVGALDGVIDIERATGLHLKSHQINTELPMAEEWQRGLTAK